MIARARHDVESEIPPSLSSSMSPRRLHLSPGEMYPIFAVSVYRGVAFFLIIDDLQTPTFLPAWLFESVAGRVSFDWICTACLGEGVELVLGPDYIAQDLRSYSAMVDQERASVEEFWSRFHRGLSEDV